MTILYPFISIIRNFKYLRLDIYIGHVENQKNDTFTVPVLVYKL
jgi:hypothetical protein